MMPLLPMPVTTTRPAAAINQLDRIVESRSHRPRDAVGQRTQRLSLDSDYVFANVFHGSKRC